jgi:hypothetical protein
MVLDAPRRYTAIGESHERAEGLAPLVECLARCVRRASGRHHVEYPLDLRVERHARAKPG